MTPKTFMASFIVLVVIFGCGENIRGLEMDLHSPVIIDSNAYRNGNFSVYPEITIEFSEPMMFSIPTLTPADYVIVIPTSKYSEGLWDDLNSPPVSKQAQEISSRVNVFFEDNNLIVHIRALFALEPNQQYILLLSEKITDRSNNPLLSVSYKKNNEVRYGSLISFATGSVTDNEPPRIQVIVPSQSLPMPVNIRHFLFVSDKELMKVPKDTFYFQSIEDKTDRVALDVEFIDNVTLHSFVHLENTVSEGSIQDIFTDGRTYKLCLKKPIYAQNGQKISSLLEQDLQFIANGYGNGFEEKDIHEISYYIKDSFLYMIIKTLIPVQIHAGLNGLDNPSSLSHHTLFSQNHEIKLGPIVFEGDYHLVIHATDLFDNKVRILDETLLFQHPPKIYINEVVTDPQQDWITNTASETLQMYPGFDKPSFRDEWIELVHDEEYPINLLETPVTIQTIDSSPEQTIIDSDTVLFISDTGKIDDWKKGQLLVINTQGNMNNLDLTIRVLFGDNTVTDELILSKTSLSGNASSPDDQSVCKIRESWKKCRATPGKPNFYTDQ